jgi:recombination protein RecR
MSDRPSSSAYPPAVDRLIRELAKMPGIGARSAERLAFYLLKSDRDAVLALAASIADLKNAVKHCSLCFNLTQADPCPICASPRRDHERILVVEQPKDLIALEQTGMYQGLYHVLMGRISPLDGVGPSDLTVATLLRRIDDPAVNDGIKVREVILGLNPTLEGDGTALYLAEELRNKGVQITRLARGLPTGWQLEYANKAVLADAIQGRQSMS